MSENFRNMKSTDIEVSEVPGFNLNRNKKRSLTQEKRNQVGSKIQLPLSGGRTAVMELRRIPADNVKQATMVFAANERVQDLLTEDALKDILDSMRGVHHSQSGQRIPAIGREICGVLEVADGSRRRMSCILAYEDFWCWVGDLSDSDMRDLSEVGNHHKRPSEWERARRVMQRLTTEFDGNKTLAESVMKVSRRQLGRMEKVALLPVELVRAYPCPNDMSARQAIRLVDALQKASDEQKEWAISKSATGLYVPWEEGCGISKAEMITQCLEEILGIKKPAVANANKGSTPAATASMDTTAVMTHKLTFNAKKGTANIKLANMPARVMEELQAAMATVLANYQATGWHEGVEHDLTPEDLIIAIENVNDASREFSDTDPELLFAAKQRVFLALAFTSNTYHTAIREMRSFFSSAEQ